jgi:hypothetical protein
MSMVARATIIGKLKDVKKARIEMRAFLLPFNRRI